MAIELNNRTKILAGVVVLAAVGAGAWFFFLEDFLREPPPKPAVAKSAPANASKAAAGAPAAAAPKQADAAKPAAAAAKPAAAAPAGPVPTDPEKAAREFMGGIGGQGGIGGHTITAAIVLGRKLQVPKSAEKEIKAAFDRAFELEPLYLEIFENMKKDHDVGRMSRYLELRRQPIARKMIAMRGEDLNDLEIEARAKLTGAKLTANPPSTERGKLLARIDELDRKSGLSAEMSQTVGRGYVEGVLESVQSWKDVKAALTKIGKGDPNNARAVLQSEVTGDRSEAIRRSVHFWAVQYFNATDAELAEYVKLIDTEIGEWGTARLAAALVPAMEKRAREVGRMVAQAAIGGLETTAKTKGSAAQPVPMAKEEKPEQKLTPAAAAPVEAPGYQRPANIREAYSRYNDVITATVMRDRAAVKELLDDGKNPNARQKDGITPLMVAASNGDTEIVSMLLAKGADPNLRAGSRSALSMAKARGSAGAGMVQLLVRSGAKD